MKKKKSPVGQYILDGLGDTDNAYVHIHNVEPVIGEVVVQFNSLEAAVSSLICTYISDRSDSHGLIVIQNLMYKTKVELFERFARELQRVYGKEIANFEKLIANLKECGDLRNRVVHANWEYTDENQFTQVRVRYTKNGLEHELWQFTEDSLQKILKLLYDTEHALSDFSDAEYDMIAEWEKEATERAKKYRESLKKDD